MSFLIMAFFFGIITVLSQGKGPYEMIFPLYQRLLFGCFALVEYITKSLLPVNLNFFYPFPIVIGGGTALTLLPLSGSAIVSYGVDHSLSE